MSIHATDPEVRARMLRNRRGATSLRWLRALLDHGVEVHGQVVVCPGVNDGPCSTTPWPACSTSTPSWPGWPACPSGVSRFNREAAMRPHTPAEAAAVVDLVEDWQAIFSGCLGRRLVYAADEYYLLAGRPFPALETYGAVAQHDNGVGMAPGLRGVVRSASTARRAGTQGPSGFFQSVDGAPALRLPGAHAPAGAWPCRPRRGAGVTVLTGEYGARVLAPLVVGLARRRRGGGRAQRVLRRATSPSPACSPAPTWPRLAGAERAAATCFPDSCLSGGQVPGRDGSRRPPAAGGGGAGRRGALRRVLAPARTPALGRHQVSVGGTGPVSDGRPVPLTAAPWSPSSGGPTSASAPSSTASSAGARRSWRSARA